MILSPISRERLPDELDRFDRCLRGDDTALAAFRRIAHTLEWVKGETLRLSTRPEHHAQAQALCRRFGLAVAFGPPPPPLTWDGHAVKGDMEPSVIIHEVAHYQVAAPDRRGTVDFGLGAGPETTDKETAERAQSVFGVEREIEEARASLLGILWEAELGQPAVLAFLEQNWLEGGDTPRNREHFRRILNDLLSHGIVDDRGVPCLQMWPGPASGIRKDHFC